MRRKLLGLLSLLVTCGLVAAMVQAQESSRRTASRAFKVSDGGRDRAVVDQLRSAIGAVSSEYRPASKSAESVSRDEEPAASPAPGPAPRMISEAEESTVEGLPSVLKRSPSPPTAVYDGPAPLEPAPSGLANGKRSSRRTARLSSPAEVSGDDSAGPLPVIRAPQQPEVALTSQGPQLRVETVGPASITIGKRAMYTVTLINEGAIAASDVYVRIAVPASVTVEGGKASAGEIRERTNEGAAIWTVHQLAARARAQLSLDLVPQENRPFDLTVDWTFRPGSVTAQIEVQQPELEVAIAGPDEVRYGETQTYVITLSNPGNGDAENVTVNLLAAGTAAGSKQIGALAAGERREMEVELTANDAGMMEIRATATAAGDLSDEATKQIRVLRAQLAVEVSGPRLQYAGTTADYEVRIANNGDAPASEVVARAQLPAGAALLGELAASSPDQSFWQIGELEPGAQRVLRIQCELTRAGENELQIILEGTGALAASGKCVTRVEAVADLKLVVNDPQGPRPVDEEVTYEVTLINRGSQAARQIQLLAQFSEGIEPVKFSGLRGQIVPGQVLFDAIDRIGAGEQVVVKIAARAATSGSHRFRVEVKCHDPETRLVSEETTRFFGEPDK